MFSESSPGRWAVLQLPCCPSKQGELSDNFFQNRSHNLTPQTVYTLTQCENPPTRCVQALPQPPGDQAEAEQERLQDPRVRGRP